MSGVALIIGGKGLKGGSKPTMKDVEGDSEEPTVGKADEEAKREAARALIRAIKNGDPEAASEALTAHYDACESGEHEEMGYEEEKEEE